MVMFSQGVIQSLNFELECLTMGNVLCIPAYGMLNRTQLLSPLGCQCSPISHWMVAYFYTKQGVRHAMCGWLGKVS